MASAVSIYTYQTKLWYPDIDPEPVAKDAKLSVMAYFSDIVDLGTSGTIIRNDIQGAINFLQGIFDDDFWYTQPFLLPPQFTSEKAIDIVRSVFPNAIIPAYGTTYGETIPGQLSSEDGILFNNLYVASSKTDLKFPYRKDLGGGYHGNLFWQSGHASSSGELVDIQFLILPLSWISGDTLTLPEREFDGARKYITGARQVQITLGILNGNKYFAYYVMGNQNIYMDDQTYDMMNGYKPPILSSDPYGPGGTSGPGGGDGSFTDDNIPVGIPPLPTFSAVDSGFLTLWNPNKSQLQNLAKYMWSDNFDINGWKKLFADPMDAILGLSLVPVPVPDGGMSNLTIGNIDTGVNMTRAGSQWVEVDCGSVTMNKYWGAYLDQEPHTKLDIVLPFIGVHSVSADEIMGKTVHVVYHVDILSGACMAFVEVGGSILYTFTGQCSIQLPVTSADFSSQIMGALQIAGQIGSLVATGGMSAPLALPGMAATAINSVKPSIERSGALAGNAGFLGVLTPYFIITRPRQAIPDRQNEFIGYPTYITRLLGDVAGYTQIESIHLENVPCTDTELSEIDQLLRGGVLF